LQRNFNSLIFKQLNYGKEKRYRNHVGKVSSLFLRAKFGRFGKGLYLCPSISKYDRLTIKIEDYETDNISQIHSPGDGHAYAWRKHAGSYDGR
jgi:hypothetical protein